MAAFKTLGSQLTGLGQQSCCSNRRGPRLCEKHSDDLALGPQRRSEIQPELQTPQPLRWVPGKPTPEKSRGRCPTLRSPQLRKSTLNRTAGIPLQLSGGRQFGETVAVNPRICDLAVATHAKSQVLTISSYPHVRVQDSKRSRLATANFWALSELKDLISRLSSRILISTSSGNMQKPEGKPRALFWDSLDSTSQGWPQLPGARTLRAHI